nr:MAG TPA: hypothetical protein [Caudoviricetes sp.]
MPNAHPGGGPVSGGGLKTTPGGACKHPGGCSVPGGGLKPPPGGGVKHPGGRSCEQGATVYISSVAFRVSGGHSILWRGGGARGVLPYRDESVQALA